MSEHLVSEALRRRELFDRLSVFLKRLKEIVLGVDPKAEVYLFGSVAEGTYNFSSDVDVLIVTNEDRFKMLEAVVKEDFAEIFEFHVRKPKEKAWYEKMTRLVRI